MTIGASLVLVAVGAILMYAVERQVSGIDIDVVGAILLIVGLVGLVVGLVLNSGWRRHSPDDPGPPL